MGKKSNDRRVAVYDSTHVMYIDPETGNLEIYKRTTADSAPSHADRLKGLNNKHSEFWRKRNEEE
jgi:hypothetical protein